MKDYQAPMKVLLGLLFAGICASSQNGLEYVSLPAGQLPNAAGQSLQVPAFRIGKNDVTVNEFKTCVSAGVCSSAPMERDEQKERCNGKNGRFDHPINCISWPEAKQFCEWQGGRLPTASEWEYAASSGDPTRRYPWGNADVDAERANFCDVNCANALGTDGKNLRLWRERGWISEHANDGWAATSPVGRFPKGASSWGLLDMAGNVWQWTSTESGPGARAVRGGSWDNAPPSLEIRHALSWPETGADAGMGFRCVKP
jgi:formylglycine-generating enzyme required for sulfatase activity